MHYISSAEAPKFPFLSQVSIMDNGTVCVSGMVGIVPESQPPRLEETVAAQTTRALEYVKNCLEAAGSDVGHIAMVHILHTDQADYPLINDAYIDYLDSAGIDQSNRPPRIATGAAFLPLGAAVEISVTAERI